MLNSSDLFSMALFAALASFMASVMIIWTKRWHGNHSLDSDITGSQKFHKKPVPRIGGIAMLIGILAAIISDLAEVPPGPLEENPQNLSKLLLAAMPVFIAGMTEDLTKTVSVTARLLAAFASALLACWLTGALLPRLDIWGVDILLRITPVAMVVTAFAVAGVTNAINIIDGFNGLAGGVAAIILAGIGFLAWQTGDMFIAKLAIAGAGAAIGFLLLNYPAGWLFMGDGGAYLLGFWIAEIAVLEIVRNPSINAWQILAICAYPIIEVIFSMYRRKVMQKASIGAPDRLHLHSLIYRRLAWRLVPHSDHHPWIRNAAVVCIVLAWMIPATLLAIFAGSTIPGAIAIVTLQVFSYLAFYARLVRRRWCFNPAVIFGLRSEHRTKSV